MLPRLQAEERLNAITDVAIGTGSMERSEQSEVIAALRRDAAIARPRAVKANMAQLADMGIAIRAPAAAAAEKAVSDG